MQPRGSAMVAMDTLVCRVSFPVPEDRSHFPGASVSARAAFRCGGMGAALGMLRQGTGY